jgi:hypothetical protein
VVLMASEKIPVWKMVVIAMLTGAVTSCVMDEFKARMKNDEGTPKTRVTEPCRPGTTLHIPTEGKYKDFLICLPDFAQP